MKKLKFFTLLVLSGALLLPACNSTASSIIDDIKSSAQPSSSQGGDNNSSQSTPAPSSSNNGGGQSSNSSQPGSSNSGGNSNSSQPSGGTTTRYEITASEWDSMIVQYGLMGPESNLTLHQAIKVGSMTVQTAILENNYGDLHMLSSSMGEEDFETYIDRLADGSYELYEVNDAGNWEKTPVPAAYFAYFSATFSSVIPPLPYSTFTYDAADHAYKSAGGQIDVGNNEKINVSNVVAIFEDGKLMSFTFDMSEEGVVGNVSVLASKYGSTSFSFPEVGSSSGHGTGETPDDSLFVNSLFRYKEEKDFQRYDKDITKEQVLGYLATSEIMLFADGEFEMYYKDAAGLRYVTLGSYTVPEKAYAELVTRSLYSDKDRQYSFNIPALYEEFGLFYNDETGDYEMSTFFLNNDGDVLAKLTLVFTRTSEQPMHLDLPQEPVNDKWSVSKEVWNKHFGGSFINRQTNITINHGDNVLALDNGKVYSKISYAYGDGAKEIYLKLLNDELNKVDYYEYDATNQIWTVRQNVDFAFDNMFMDETGIKAYDFDNATYNSVGHYYAIRKFIEYPYGEETGYSVEYTEIKIYFENNQLQKISYKHYGVEDTFIYSKAGSTTVTLPDVGTAPILEDLFVGKGFKYNSYTSSNSAFEISSYAASLANDEIRFFHDTTDYTFEWLMDNRTYDGTSDNSIVLCGKYVVKRSSSSLYEYQYYISLQVKNVYVNGMELDKETDGGLFETLTVYYFEADDKLCYREDSVPFKLADNTTDFTNIRLYFKAVSGTASHFDLPRLDDNWSQYDVIMAMSQIGVLNDDLPIMHYVKTFSIGTVDTTNKSFDITCGMPNEFFVKHVFEPYKSALVNQYRFKAEYDTAGDIAAVISPNGEFKVTFELKKDYSIIFHVQYYVTTIPEAVYPSSTVATFLRANSVTDPVPEFKVAGASRYDASSGSDYLFITIYLDATLIDNATTSLIKLLTDLEYAPSNVGEMVVYTSKNNQLSVVVSPYKDMGAIQVILTKPVSQSMLSEYPTKEQNDYLTGVTDSIPNFDNEDGEQYATFGPSDDVYGFNVSIYLKQDTTVNVKTLVEGFEKDLVDNYGYEKMLLVIDDYEDEYIVSKNKQVAINFQYSVADKAYNIEFVNLSLLDNYQLLRGDDPVSLSLWNVQGDFTIGDEFTLGEEASAYVTLVDGAELEISIDDLSYEAITFEKEGEQEIVISYTSNGVTVEATVWVYVSKVEPEQEYEDYTVTITNLADLEGMEEGVIMYAVVKSEYAPDGEWCAMEMVSDTENVFTVYDVNTLGQEMTIFVEGEDGEVLYFVTVRLVVGQVEYTVSLRPNSN